MTGMTDFITETRWVDTFIYWFVLIDDVYNVLEDKFGGWRRRGPRPAFSDSEVITVALIIDTWFSGDEAKGLSFLRQYHGDLFPTLPGNGRFNERRRALRLIMEQIRRQLLQTFALLDEEDPYRFVDSAPVPVCSYGRAARNETVAGPQYVGYLASSKAKFFGFRLQASVTLDQVVDHWLLAPAARKDGKMLSALFAEAQNLVVFGDNAYHDPGEHNLLRRTRRVLVWAVPRRDSSEPWPSAFKRLVKRLRLRVETAFSVLTTVFNIERPGSRSLSGLIARTATRLLAYTLCFITAPRIAQFTS